MGRPPVAALILVVLATAIGIPPASTLAASAPGVPTNLSPANGSSGTSTDPILQAAVSDPDGGQLTTSFYGRKAGPVSAEDFTIVVIPDTQHYVDDAGRAATFNQQTQWIVDHVDDLNVVFVSHLGDISQSYDTSSVEFVRADSAMDTLDNAGIPNNIAPGNHDFSTPGAATSNLFDAWFPPSRYDLPVNPWYGGWLGEEAGQVQRLNKDNYELFSAAGIDFLIVHLEVDMPTYAVQWADEIIDRYPNRQVIISTHAFLNGSSARGTSRITTRPDGLSAAQVWTQLIAPNCNIFMVVNGHYSEEGRLTSTNSCGQPVHQVLTDYQNRVNGGDGWLRYYTFRPASNVIEARTYSPKLGTFEVDASSQFTLPYAMSASAGFEPIGSVQTASGGVAAVPWPARAQNTTYEWYAVTSDGVATRRSPTWTFTTAGPPPPPNREPTFDQDLGNRTDPEGAVISLDAGATDPDGDALTYAATNLPAGVSINPATGLITGTIASTAAPGPYAVSVTVRDGPTVDATDTFSWTVTDVVVPPPPAAAIGLRSVSYGSNNAVVTSITAARPAGVAAGDVLLASIDTRGSSTVSAPAGWTLLRMDINASSLRKSTYLRVAGGAEPATYTWTFSGSRLAAAVIHAYTGVDPVNPVDAVGGGVNPSGTAVTAPSITTTVADTMLVGFFAKQSSGTWTPPAGMTERGEINGAGGSQTTSATGVDAIRAAIGPTGTRVATASSGALNVAHLVALRPAAP